MANRFVPESPSWRQWARAGRVAVFAAILSAGCTQDPVPQDSFYRLSGPSDVQPAPAPVLSGVLEVARFRADGLVAGRSLVYSRADVPQRLNEYNYHFWVEPPTVMLQDRLIAFARDARLAATVVTPEMRVEPEYMLSGRIQRFEQVIGAQPQAVLSMEIGLHTGDGRLVLLESYAHVEPAADTSVPATIVAFDRALAAILARLADDLRRL